MASDSWSGWKLWAKIAGIAWFLFCVGLAIYKVTR
jgi:hypothetical protein